MFHTEYGALPHPGPSHKGHRHPHAHLPITDGETDSPGAADDTVIDGDVITVSDEEFEDYSSVEEAVHRLCLSPWSRRPRPSRIELECLQLVQFAQVKAPVMMRRFRDYPRLANRVLHEAQQARHCGPGLRSVGHAVALVGPKGLRPFLLEASVRQSIFDGADVGGPLWALYRHTMAVVAIASALAPQCMLASDDVVEAALFHDAGTAVAFSQALEERDAFGLSSPEALAFGVATVRSELTLQCAENWRLSAATCEILFDLQRHRDHQDLHPAVALLVLADEMAMRLGFDVLVNGSAQGPHDLPCAQSLAWAQDALCIGDVTPKDIEEQALLALAPLASMT
jgi:hypothetical protein